MPVRPARLTLMLVGWNRHQAKLSQGLYGCFPGHGVLSNGSQKRCNSAEWAPLFFAAVQFCTWALLVGACATLEHPKGTGPVLGRFRIWDAAFIKPCASSTRLTKGHWVRFRLNLRRSFASGSTRTSRSLYWPCRPMTVHSRLWEGCRKMERDGARLRRRLFRRGCVKPSHGPLSPLVAVLFPGRRTPILMSLAYQRS